MICKSKVLVILGYSLLPSEENKIYAKSLLNQFDNLLCKLYGSNRLDSRAIFDKFELLGYSYNIFFHAYILLIFTSVRANVLIVRTYMIHYWTMRREETGTIKPEVETYWASACYECCWLVQLRIANVFFACSPNVLVTAWLETQSLH